MSVDTLRFLSHFYNMTIFQFKVPYQTEKKRYQLEINPGFVNEGAYDKFNVIEARWIDTITGLFIDITSVRPNETARALGIEGALKCRDKHNYLEKDLFPLRDGTFENTPVKIPLQYIYLLEEEYTKASLTRQQWENHDWNRVSLTWEPRKLAKLPGRAGHRGPHPGRGARTP